MQIVRGKFVERALKEWLFWGSAFALGITSLISERLPHYDLKDFKILYILLVFLVSVKGLERGGFFTGVSSVISHSKFLPQKLLILTAVLSMLVTNDVALFIMVPLTLAIDIREVETLVILETLVANGASSLTPFGNPQNIFIYFHYNLHPMEFMMAIAPVSLFSTALALALSFRVSSNSPVSIGLKRPHGKTLIYLFFFTLFVLSTLRVLPLWIGAVPLAYAAVFDRKSLIVDYFLIGTFFLFFGITDNLMNIMKITLINAREVFLYSALSSQVMSNVPSALFFADFTGDWRALLCGVNVGGFGSIVSSLANLISYKFYRSRYPNAKGFLLRFFMYGLLFLTLGMLLCMFMIL